MEKLFNLLYGSREEIREVYQLSNRWYRSVDPAGVHAWTIDRLFLNPGDATEGAKKDRASISPEVVDGAKQKIKNPNPGFPEGNLGKRIDITI